MDTANSPGNPKDINPIKKETLKERILRLLKLHSSPKEISLGVAIGVFISITPLYGLHTIMAIAAALLIRRSNKIAILLGTNVSSVFTIPFITWAGYSIGRWMLGNSYPILNWDKFKQFSYKELLGLYYPLFIGSLVLGLFLAIFAYYLTLLLINIHRNKQNKLKNG